MIKLRQNLLWCVFLAGILLVPALLVAQDVPANLTIHVVQRGENLFRIALHYGLTIEEMAQLNGIVDPGSIQVGQRLLVPSETTQIQTQTLSHVVQAGETLHSIADSYDKSVEELSTLNDIADVNAIYVGQTLTIASAEVMPTLTPDSVAEPTVAPTTMPSTAIHVVQAGETLFRIALNYGLTVNELAQANAIVDPTTIFVGQQLLIPGVQPPHLALDLPAPITNLEITPQILVEGKTGQIRVSSSESVSMTGTFLGHAYPVISSEDNTIHNLFIGIPMYTNAGIYPLNITITPTSGTVQSLTVNVQVVSGNYGSEYITLPADKVNLLATAVEDNEFGILQRLTSTVSPNRYFVGAMGLPAAAPMNAPFGTLRAYNGNEFDRYHTGADFAGAPGSPINAPAAGQVVLADTLNIRGVTTAVDHGWGIYSVFAHQTERYVNVGEFVSAGQVIGTIGNSGRATGAHLHWEIWVNGVPVDPMQWVSQPFN